MGQPNPTRTQMDPVNCNFNSQKKLGNVQNLVVNFFRNTQTKEKINGNIQFQKYNTKLKKL